MNSIINLAIRNIKNNKSRNILTVLTVILATCLITSIGILSYSIQHMMVEQVVKQTGRVHVKYKNISQSQIEILRNNLRIEAVGEVAVPNINVRDDRLGSISLSILYTDDLEMANIKLEKGNLPIKANEIALQKWIIEKLGVKPQIGENISINCLVTDTDGVEYERKYNFILSGILKDKDINKDLYISSALISKDFIEENANYVDITRHAHARVKGRGNLTKTALDIGYNIGIKDENIKINTTYINVLGGDVGSLIPFILVGIIVMTAAAIVIYNIFYISVVYRVNQFGLLSSIGATKKQIKKVILTEGFLTAVIGIPAGLALGYITALYVIPAFSLEELLIKSSPYIFAISALVSLLTVAVAVYKPARTASKVSPIEAIRYTGVEFKSIKGKRKGGGNISIGRIAWLNLWRNKKRTIMTMLSLTMSGILFIIFSTILSGMNVENLASVYVTGDIQLTCNNVRFDDGSNPLNNQFIESIKKINGIESVNIIKHDWVCMDVDSSGGTRELNCDIYGFEDKLMLKQLEHLVSEPVLLNSLKNKNMILILTEGSDDRNYKPGDKIKIKKYNRDKTYNEIEVTVAGYVDKRISWIGMKGIGPTFIAHHGLFERVGLDSRVDRISVNVNEQKYEIVKNALVQIIEDNDNITYMSHKEIKEQRTREIRGIKIAVMGLVGIIGVIGILNLINTMITSIFTRKKEIGILQAVGLSDKQLRKMLQLEGLYYSVISAVMSVVLGTILGYIFFQLFRRSATYAEYVFPLSSIIIISLVYLLVQAVITLIVERRVRKDSIIDRIRYIG